MRTRLYWKVTDLRGLQTFHELRVRGQTFALAAAERLGGGRGTSGGAPEAQVVSVAEIHDLALDDAALLHALQGVLEPTCSVFRKGKVL